MFIGCYCMCTTFTVDHLLVFYFAVQSHKTLKFCIIRVNVRKLSSGITPAFIVLS